MTRESKGRPYNLKSQGVVEKIHSILRKALLCRFIENPINFNLSEALNKVMVVYNNTFHNTTK